MRNLMLRGYTWARARKSEEGQTALEYALIAAFVSIVLVGLLIGIGTGVVQGAVSAVNGFGGGGS